MLILLVLSINCDILDIVHNLIVVSVTLARKI